MRRTHFLLLSIAWLGNPAATGAGSLQVRTLPAPDVVGSTVIVGRAHCGGVTWLLNEAPQLTRVTIATSTPTSSPVRGLLRNEKVWGLACANNELWTLTAHDVLARLQPDGQVAERLRLDRPRLAVYSAGERLLLQQPPTAVGRPLLAAGLPRQPSGFRPWPAPLSQPMTSRGEQLTSNLVTCGLGAADFAPCWLANQVRVVISDGSPAHTTAHELHFVRRSAIDEAVPIWDVALAGSWRVWVLASARAGADGRRVGGRLTKSNRRGSDEGFLDLSPAARLILWADESRCVLLSSTGQLLEVTDR
jgi:hypothetical protein